MVYFSSTTYGISEKYYPREIFSGWEVIFNKHCKTVFACYVESTKDVTVKNNMNTQTYDCIKMVPQEIYKVLKMFLTFILAEFWNAGISRIFSYLIGLWDSLMIGERSPRANSMQKISKFQTERNINITGTMMNWRKLKAFSRMSFLILILPQNWWSLTFICNKWCQYKTSRAAAQNM